LLGRFVARVVRHLPARRALREDARIGAGVLAPLVDDLGQRVGDRLDLVAGQPVVRRRPVHPRQGLGLLRLGGRGEQEGEDDCAPQRANDHSLFPTKFSGVTAMIASACAGSCGTPASTSTVSTARMTRNATNETTKNRAAWNPACPSRAPKVQCRFHQKLLSTPPTQAPVAAPR